MKVAGEYMMKQNYPHLLILRLSMLGKLLQIKSKY